MYNLQKVFFILQNIIIFVMKMNTLFFILLIINLKFLL
jgi:hypothetical protein